MYIKREVDTKIEHWIEDFREAVNVLILTGPRGVGKRTSVKQLTKNAFKNIVNVDLEFNTNFVEFMKNHIADGDAVLQYFQENDITFDDTGDSLLILTSLQCCEWWGDVIDYLGSFHFKTICVMDFVTNKELKIRDLPQFTVIEMSGITYQEFIGCYDAAEEYHEMVGSLDRPNSSKIEEGTEVSRFNPAWFADALEVWASVGGFPNAVDDYIGNGDWSYAVYGSIYNLCHQIAHELKINPTVVDKTLKCLAAMTLAKSHTFNDVELELYDEMRRLHPEIENTSVCTMVKAFINYGLISVIPIYKVKKNGNVKKSCKCKVFFCNHAAFTYLTKVNFVPATTESSYNDNLIYSMYRNALIREGKQNMDLSLSYVVYKGSDIGFCLNDYNNCVPYLIAMADKKLSQTLYINFRVIRFTWDTFKHAKSVDCPYLPLFTLPEILLKEENFSQVTLPELDELV